MTSPPITKPEDASCETIAAERARMLRARDVALVSPTIAASLDDAGEWVPTGPSGEYTFLFSE